MKYRKQSKMVVILALCVSVVGLSLGFAAFSNTLTISSNANVKPSQSDFLLKAYGLAESNINLDLWTKDPYVSSSISKPLFYGLKADQTATDAYISNGVDQEGGNTITISNINIGWTNIDQPIEYWFMIKNEGKYDAYLLQSDFDKLANIKDQIVCTAAPGTSESMVQSACEGVDFFVQANSSDQMTILNPNGSEGGNYIKINKYVSESNFDYITFGIALNYVGELADGDFTVRIPSISLEFTSVPPAE